MRYLMAACLLLALWVVPAAAIDVPTFTIGVGQAESPEQVSTVIQLLVLLTVLSLAPAIMLMTTAFIRIVIVLSFVRQAMGTQQMPPNQVIIGLALFLTFFVMSPVLDEINTTALQPYLQEEIGQQQALDNAVQPLRSFMLKHAGEDELKLLLDVARIEVPDSPDDLPTLTLIPAFMLSELKRAFQIGFMIFVPFLVIDMIVASVLMAMGMMMLPPVIISLPFKLLLFVLVDGWTLIVGSLVQSFQ